MSSIETNVIWKSKDGEWRLILYNLRTGRPANPAMTVITGRSASSDPHTLTLSIRTRTGPSRSRGSRARAQPRTKQGRFTTREMASRPRKANGQFKKKRR